MQPPDVTGRRNVLLWGTPKTGAQLKNSGFTVSMNRVPVTVGEWDSAPYEAHYLRLVDVTDPLETEISQISVAGTDVTVSCEAIPGRYYHLEASTDGLDGTWTTVVSNIRAEGSALTLTHGGGADAGARFYRVWVSYVKL